MCLCSHVHKYHERAFFALKPKEISNDKKTLKVEFYWLSQYGHSNQVDILRTPSIPERLNGTTLDGRTRRVGLWNIDTDEKIRSEDVICLDPEELPLPDSRLLDMQWILYWVSALSGAAEPSDFDKDNDDLDDLLTDDEWSAYTPSPREFSPPSSPPHRSSVLPFPHQGSSIRCYRG